MKPLLLLLAMGLSLFVRAQTSIQFENNSSSIDAKSRLAIERIADEYKLKPSAIRIAGYADTIGNAQANIQLSRKRADAVARVLTSLKVNPANLIIEAYGETGLQNRIVQISFERNYTQPANPLSQWKPKVQRFTVDVSKAIEIKGASGTIVQFPADAFVNSKGEPIEGNIEIMLREFISTKDIMTQGLATLSDGQLLETSGMVDIRATDGREQFQLAKGKQVTITFQRSSETDFGLFNGVKMPDGSVNWKRGAVQAYLTPDGLGASDLSDAPIDTAVVGDFVLRRTDSSISRDVTVSTVTGSTVTISSPRLNWINCDRFIYDKNTQYVNCEFRSQDASIQTGMAYLIFKNIKSMLGLASADKLLTYQGNLPVGREVILFVLGFKGGDLYLHRSKITLSPNMRQNIGFQKIEPKALDEVMRGL